MHVHAAPRRGDARGGLEGDAGNDVLARGDAAEHPPGVVGEEAGSIPLVAVVAAPLPHAVEACAELHSLYGVDAGQRRRQIRIELAEHRLAEAHGHVPRQHGHLGADGVPLSAQLVDQRRDVRHRRRVRAEEGVAVHGVEVRRRQRQIADLRQKAVDANAGLAGKVLAGDGAGGNAHGRLPGRRAAAAPVVAHPVLGVVGEVGVGRPILVLDAAVVPRALVDVVDGQADGGAGGDALEHPGENAYLVRLPALGGVLRPPRAAAIQIPLQVRLVEGHARGAAIDDGAKRRAVALAEGGDGKGLSEGVAGHRRSLPHTVHPGHSLPITRSAKFRA